MWNPGNSSRSASSSSFTETIPVPLSGHHHGCGRLRPGHSRAVPAQLEEDGPAVLVTVLSPPARDQIHEFEAPAALREFLEASDRGSGLGAVVAYLHAQRVVRAVDGDLE